MSKERKGPTDKQKIFVEAYLRTWNATQAAREAGYQIPEQSGYENLRKPEVQKLIRDRLSDEKVLTSEVLSRTLSQMRGSLADFLTPTGELDLARAQARGQLHLLKKIEFSDLGGVKKIELHSSENARRDLMQHLGLLMSDTQQDILEEQLDMLRLKKEEYLKRDELLTLLRKKASKEVYLAVLEILAREDEEESEETPKQTPAKPAEPTPTH